MLDLAIRGGTLVTAAGRRQADIAIEGGIIVAIGRVEETARELVDATGQVVLPGVIDVHVHFNEPGRTEWEGAATGSRALAAGGGTVFFDMPLNSSPCTIGVEDFDRKRTALESSSIADFGLWGGLVPGRIGDMAPMAERGVVGFKAFMCDSGLPEFPRADAATLVAGMREAARLGLPVAVHAENDEMTRELARAAATSSWRDVVSTRPALAELDAIQQALLFAGETGAALHIVHVSTGRGVLLARDARARGVDVTVETCPHYLLFTEEDIDRLGTAVKCAPPLRPETDRAELWAALLAGDIDLIASDHSPTDPALKAQAYASAWGGIAGVQTTLIALLDAGHHQRGLPLERVAALLAAAPSRRFHLAGKGELAVGADADLVIVALDAARTHQASDLQQRHKSSPYAGRTFHGAVRRTVRRGETIFLDGRITAQRAGVLIRPQLGG